MFKRMGGGEKGFLYNVKKKLHFPCRIASPSEKISKVMMEKNLRFNEDKCVVTIGTKNKERKQRFS